MAAALSLAFWGRKSGQSDKIYDAPRFKKSAFISKTLEEAKEMRELALHSKNLGARIQKIDHKYLVDGGIELTPNTAKFQELKSNLMRARQLAHYGYYFFIATSLAVTVYVLKKMSSWYGKAGAIIPLAMAFLVHSNFSQNIKFLSDCLSRADRFLNEQALIHDFANERFNSYPSSFSSIDQNTALQYMHPQEVELLYHLELARLDQDRCETLFAQAAWVRSLIRDYAKVFDHQRKFDNWHFDLKDRFTAICTSFSFFCEFHQDQFKKSPLSQFFLLADILGKSAGSIKWSPDDLKEINDFDISTFKEDAYRALIRIQPNTDDVLFAHHAALQYDSVFYPIARQFLNAALDPTKPLPEKFSVAPGFESYMIPKTLSLVPLSQANQNDFLIAARRELTNEHKRDIYEKFLQSVIKNIPQE